MPSDSPPPASDAAAAARLLRALEIDEEGHSAASSCLPQIEGYVVTALIGSGASGAVYLGRRHASSLQVAIKVLRHVDAAAANSRAWRELDILAQLRLSAVPRVLDYGTCDGRLFIVTEFIAGVALDEYCQQQRLGLRERVALLRRTATAVQALHEHGVIHRDLKPQNVLVDGNGQPIIIDLGLAMLCTDALLQTLTIEGTPIGSPAYMAPEQARGDRQQISTRSDIYSLGAIGYRLLTGSTPHDMDTTLHEAIRRVATNPPRDPRALAPSLPRPLARVLLKASAQASSARYATAAELAKDLGRWHAGEPVEAGGLSPFQRGLQFVSHHPILATAGSAASIAAIIFATTLLGIWLASVRPHDVELTSRGTAVLNSRIGAVIHEWPEAVTPARTFVPRLLRRTRPSPARLAVMAFDNHVQRGTLCAFDVDRSVDEPVWTLSPELLLGDHASWPSDLKSIDPFDFNPVLVKAIDIFEDPPGHEQCELLVVVQHRLYSPCLIQVRDLAGQILYQTWHQGSVADAYYLEASGQVVLVGRNSDGAWIDRGGQCEASPLVIYSIKPAQGHIGNHLLGAGSPPHLDEDRPRWYRCLWPPETSDHLVAERLTSEEPWYDPARTFRLELSARSNPMAHIALLVDEHGKEIKRMPRADERYQRDGTLLPASLVELRDLPRKIDAK